MAKPQVVIIGASGHGRVVADAIASVGIMELVGWLDPGFAKGTLIHDRPVLGSEEDLSMLIPEYALTGYFIAVGDNWKRARLTNEIAQKHTTLKLVSIIHNSAIVSPYAQIGAGSVIMAGAVVQANTVVGRGVIINTRASVDHDCQLENFCSIGPGATLGGNCQIGQYSAIGLGANLLHGISVGENSVVGGGALVNKPIEANTTAVGVPAKVIASRKPEQGYL